MKFLELVTVHFERHESTLHKVHPISFIEKLW